MAKRRNLSAATVKQQLDEKAAAAVHVPAEEVEIEDTVAETAPVEPPKTVEQIVETVKVPVARAVQAPSTTDKTMVRMEQLLQGYVDTVNKSSLSGDGSAAARLLGAIVDFVVRNASINPLVLQRIYNFFVAERNNYMTPERVFRSYRSLDAMHLRAAQSFFNAFTALVRNNRFKEPFIFDLNKISTDLGNNSTIIKFFEDRIIKTRLGSAQVSSGKRH